MNIAGELPGFVNHDELSPAGTQDLYLAAEHEKETPRWLALVDENFSALGKAPRTMCRDAGDLRRAEPGKHLLVPFAWN